MYAKVYEQIFDSSLAEDYEVRHVFEDLLKLADRDGVVNRTHEAIARRTNVPLEIIKRGIDALEKPDPRSQSTEHEGRRIVRLESTRDWGWRIVNHGYYRRLGTADDKREADRDRIAAQRLEGKNATNATERDSAASAYASASVEVSAEPPAVVKPPFPRKDFDAAAKYLSVPDAMRDSCWGYYDSQGWHKSNGRKVQGDPRSLLLSWKERPQHRNGHEVEARKKINPVNLPK